MEGVEWVLDGVFGAFEGDVMCGVGEGWRVFSVLKGMYGY